MKNFAWRNLLIVGILMVSTLRCSGPQNLLSSGSSLMKALGSNPNLSSLAGLLKTPGLSNLLGSTMKSPFTLLAPTNEAISSLGSNAVADFAKPENLSQLSQLLKNHIVPGKIDPATLLKGGQSTAAGTPLNLSGANLGSLVSEKAFNLIPIDKVLK